MEVSGVEPDLITNFELFIGQARPSCDHCLLHPFMCDYCLIPICHQLLESFLCEPRSIGHIRRISSWFIAVQEIERSLSVRAMDSGIMSKLCISQIERPIVGFLRAIHAQISSNLLVYSFSFPVRLRAISSRSLHFDSRFGIEVVGEG